MGTNCGLLLRRVAVTEVTACAEVPATSIPIAAAATIIPILRYIAPSSSITNADPRKGADEIRPRSATPAFSWTQAASRRGRPWTSRAAVPATPGELCAEIWCYPPLCSKVWHGGQISVNVRTCKFVLALPWAIALAGRPEPPLRPAACRGCDLFSCRSTSLLAKRSSRDFGEWCLRFLVGAKTNGVGAGARLAKPSRSDARRAT